MKLKARDIISGWPKPKSFSVFQPGHYKPMCLMFTTWYGPEYRKLVRIEWDQTREYHAGQDRMLEKYRGEAMIDFQVEAGVLPAFPYPIPKYEAF